MHITQRSRTKFSMVYIRLGKDYVMLLSKGLWKIKLCRCGCSVLMVEYTTHTNIFLLLFIICGFVSCFTFIEQKLSRLFAYLC